jgi:hypothetical protein
MASGYIQEVTIMAISYDPFIMPQHSETIMSEDLLDMITKKKKQNQDQMLDVRGQEIKPGSIAVIIDVNHNKLLLVKVEICTRSAHHSNRYNLSFTEENSNEVQTLDIYTSYIMVMG